ncbi:helix-turn-helix domain-containing protein [Candidatus Dojkabacteria bacterium]|nr:helix-turn-helix domain-containing protein [Candidatus Dojkabacteria bacterium]
MIEPIVIGRRIRYFRKGAGMSQMGLEIEIGGSAGMISRIEKGKVNPSKETVLQIAKVLGMNDREVDYVIGSLVKPASEEEIRNAVEAVADHYSQNNVYAYLLDDRFRILHVSKGFENMFRKVLDNYDELLEKIIGDSVVAMMVDDSYGVTPFIKTKNYQEMMFYQLARVKRHMGFMKDDKWYKRIENVLGSDPDLLKLWEKADVKEINFNSLETRRIPLKIGGMEINMTLYREPQWKYPRFETVEYVPNNRFLRIVKSLIAK